MLVLTCCPKPPERCSNDGRSTGNCYRYTVHGTFFIIFSSGPKKRSCLGASTCSISASGFEPEPKALNIKRWSKGSFCFHKTAALSSNSVWCSLWRLGLEKKSWGIGTYNCQPFIRAWHVEHWTRKDSYTSGYGYCQLPAQNYPQTWQRWI